MLEMLIFEGLLSEVICSLVKVIIPYLLVKNNDFVYQISRRLTMIINMEY